MRKARDHKAEYARLKERARNAGFLSVRKFKAERKQYPSKYYSRANLSRTKKAALAQDWSDHRARMPIATFNYDAYVESHEDDFVDFMTYTEAYYAAFVESYDDDRDTGSDALYYWLVELNDWEEEEYDAKYRAE